MPIDPILPAGGVDREPDEPADLVPPPVVANALLIIGTLTDGTKPVVFPPLYFSELEEGRPIFLSPDPGADYVVNYSEGAFHAFYVGGGEWKVVTAAMHPADAGPWVPVSPATGAPTVKRATSDPVTGAITGNGAGDLGPAAPGGIIP